MKNWDYELSMEYRERFGLTEGELEYIKIAFDYYAYAMKEQINQMESDGKRSIFAPHYFEMLFNDLHNKLGMWMRPIPVYKEDE